MYCILYMLNKVKKRIFKLMLPPEKYARYIGVKVGKDCDISSRNIIWGSEPYLIEIGNKVRISFGVKFITHDGGVWVLRNYFNDKNLDVFGKIKIGNNCNIGWNVIIMPGVEIGNNCVIGAGSIVTKNIPDNSVVVGIPAKKIENIDEYYMKVKEKCDYTKDFSSKKKKEYLLKKYINRGEEK